MDDNECDTVISSAREQVGRKLPEILDGMQSAAARHRMANEERFQIRGEWSISAPRMVCR
jgi:hypothetical protein